MNTLRTEFDPNPSPASSSTPPQALSQTPSPAQSAQLAAPPLARSATLPRELVHRVSPAEVLLTDLRPAGEHAFAAAAFWPRSHPTFDRAGDGRHDPLMVAETLRELGICIPLQFYRVAPDAHFLIEDLSFDLDPGAEPRARHAGSEIVCAVQADRIRPAGKVPPRSLHLAVEFTSAGARFARAEGTARILTPAAYAAIRGQRPAEAGFAEQPECEAPDRHRLETPGAARVGVAQDADVLISVDRAGAVRLTPADPYHPFFFDHPCDHMPGMVLLEAARQAAAWRSPGPAPRTVSCAVRALHFTEPNPPALIQCTLGADACEFEIRQPSGSTAHGVLHFQRSGHST
jgi:2-oxo-3-(phosphooxy)propyl 3-oxoalkanoate synthase